MGISICCIKCMVFKFLKNNVCVDKCVVDEYGYIFVCECWKCNMDICVICSDGFDNSNCILCKEFKVFMNGKCVDNCGLKMFKKNGWCVEDCGILLYKFLGNFFCLFCFKECIVCEYKLGKFVCIICNFFFV